MSKGYVGATEVYEDAVTLTALSALAVGDTVVDRDDVVVNIIGKVTTVLNPVDVITITLSNADTIQAHPDQYIMTYQGAQIKARDMKVLTYLTATVYVDSVDVTPAASETFINLVTDAGSAIKMKNAISTPPVSETA